LAGAEKSPAIGNVQSVVVQVLGRAPDVQSWKKQLAEFLDGRFSEVISGKYNLTLKYKCYYFKKIYYFLYRWYFLFSSY
jgi:hypothetical protein